VTGNSGRRGTKTPEGVLTTNYGNIGCIGARKNIDVLQYATKERGPLQLGNPSNVGGGEDWEVGLTRAKGVA